MPMVLLLLPESRPTGQRIKTTRLMNDGATGHLVEAWRYDDRGVLSACPVNHRHHDLNGFSKVPSGSFPVFRS